MTIPDLPPWRMCTVHQILAPTDQVEKAACEVVGCLKYRKGWLVLIPPGPDQTRLHAGLVRKGRTFRESRRSDGTLVCRIDPYQRCFDNHYTRKPDFIVVNEAGREAGYRRNEPRPEFWVESLHETQDRRQADRQRG